MSKRDPKSETKDLYALDACLVMARYAVAIGNEDSSMVVELPETGDKWCVSVVKVVDTPEEPKE